MVRGPDRRIGVSAYLPPGSAYRRIGVFAPGSAYRRIGVFSGRIGVSAYFSPGPAYRRAAYRRMRVLAYASLGPRPAYRRMCPLRAMRRRFGVSGARRFCDTICRHAATLYAKDCGASMYDSGLHTAGAECVYRLTVLTTVAPQQRT